MRVIRCDCGFEASGEGDDELVERAQDHALGAHGMDLPAELVLALTRAQRNGQTAPADGSDR